MNDPKKPDYYLIDVESNEELVYIANKLGCQINDILGAVETLKSRKRSVIYSYLIDAAFKSQYK